MASYTSGSALMIPCDPNDRNSNTGCNNHETELYSIAFEDCNGSLPRPTQLLNDKEELLISNEERLTTDIFGKYPFDTLMKVVSVVGSPGEGKSYLLNKLFHKGQQEVFKTSECSKNQTSGAWTLYDEANRILYIDTQPIQTLSTNTLLLKILAISDVVIYKTRSERLTEELYRFLGEASDALVKHFRPVLNKAGHSFNPNNSVSKQGPVIIISHEPSFSKPLTKENISGDIEGYIRSNIRDLNYTTEGLGKIKYISYSTTRFDLNDLGSLQKQLKEILTNLAFRSPRTFSSIFKVIKSLSDRFKGRLKCTSVCEACHAECELTIGHEANNEAHSSENNCKYLVHCDNKESVCRDCNTRVSTVEEKDDSWYSYFAGKSYRIECENCSKTLYSNKGYWFNNTQTDEKSAIYTRFVHIWPEQYKTFNETASVTMWKVLENIDSAVKSARAYSTDFIAPSYWQPNSQITKCNLCPSPLNISLKNIHHCRACGFGVCDDCSRNEKPVPNRGWDTPVRVCNECMEDCSAAESEGDKNVRSRKTAETVINTFKPLGNFINIRTDVITGLVRPSYWVPDEASLDCAICNVKFGTKLENLRHHCRRCGKSICDGCSPHREEVPEREWHSPVRVCTNCTKNKPEPGHSPRKSRE